MSDLLGSDGSTEPRPFAQGSGLLERGRRGAKVLAEQLLPESLVVWRGREGRHMPLTALRRRLSCGAAPVASAGRVALTFDDGPTSLTSAYLDVLAELDVRATFFLVGELCEQHPELVSALAVRGHQLAGHGYTHRRFTSLSQAELADELERTRLLLPAGEGQRWLVRPPYGAVSLRSLAACRRHGFTTVLWSLNSGDWRSHDASQVERIVAEQSATAGAIVLLHEGQSWTMKALPAIVGGLRQAGHELVTVGELLA